MSDKSYDHAENIQAIFLFYFFFVIFLFQGCNHGIWKFPDEGLNPSHSHSNARSELHLWPIPQLKATLDPKPTERVQGSNLSPHECQSVLFPLSHDGHSLMYIFHQMSYSAYLWNISNLTRPVGEYIHFFFYEHYVMGERVSSQQQEMTELRRA